MIGAGIVGSAGRRRPRRTSFVTITATVPPASADLTVGERLGDTANWSVFLDPANYSTSASGQSIATVIVNYIGSTGSATDAFEDGDQNNFSITVTDSSSTTRTFTVVPRTVVHVSPAISELLQNQSFEIATGLQTYATSNAFSGANLTFTVSGPAGVSIAAQSGVVTFDTQILTEQVGTGVTVTARNSGGSADISFDLEVTAAVIFRAEITGLSNNTTFGFIAEIGQALTGVIYGLQGGETIVHRWQDGGGFITGANESSYTPVVAQNLDTVQYVPQVNGQEPVSSSITVRHAPPAAGTLAAVQATQGIGAIQVDLQSGFSGLGLTFSAPSPWVSISGNILTIDDVVRSDSVTITATNSGGSATIDLSVMITAPVVLVATPIPDQSITQNAGDITFDLRPVFENATSYSVNGAGASIDDNGYTLRLDDGALLLGVTITVTGANAFNSADDAFTLTVSAAPTVPAQMSAPLVVANSPTQVTTTLASAPFDGGSPITEYDLRYRSNGGGWTALQDVTNSTIVNAFSESDDVDVQTRAQNAIGTGSWSASSSATTPLVAPTASGTLANQTFTEGTGLQSLDTSGSFAGTDLSFSINTLAGVTLDAGTGILSFDTDAMPVQSNTPVVVTVFNASGLANNSFDLTILESAPTSYAFTNNHNGTVTFVTAGISPTPAFQDNEDGTIERTS